MRYIVFADKTTAAAVFDSDEFNTKEEAIRYAEKEWSHLSEYDKKHHDAFYVLESVNPDEEAENHFDGDIVLDLMKDHKVWTRDREAGNKIEWFKTYTEALDAIKAYETEDKADGSFTEDFYEIYVEEC